MTERVKSPDMIFDFGKAAQMSERDFARLSAFIQGKLGIRMPDVKRLMLESRLQKRLKALGLDDYGDYIDYVFSPEGRSGELQHMIDAVTTNKTDFFREPEHFEVLVGRALPELASLGLSSLRVWSCGCSTGEEPYTLAMVLEGYRDAHPAFSYEIFASDLSMKVLSEAKEATYQEERIAELPEQLKRRFFLRSKDRERKLVRVKPELRAKVSFGQINLMDDDYFERASFDVVFCRNVLIYFDRTTQEKILNKICGHLRVGGFLFLGHSEALTGMALPVETIVPTVHRRVEGGRA